MLNTKQKIPDKTYENRVKLCNTEVWLDEKPARICGILNPFATVYEIDSNVSFEFSWKTVEKIVASTKCFKS